MKRNLLIAIPIFLFYSCTFAQRADSTLYNISITKTIVKNSQRVFITIKFDSVGNIFKNELAGGKSIDILSLSTKLKNGIDEIKFVKYPGDNQIKALEFPFPEKHRQHILFHYQFKVEIDREANFLNKTYYSWGSSFDISDANLPIYKLFLESEIRILHELLL